MKKIKVFSFICVLLVLLIYTTNVTAIPNNIILLDNEELNINTVMGVTLNKKEDNKYDAKEASSIINEKIDSLKEEQYQVSLFNTIPLKTIQTNIIPKTEVIPLGKTVGLKLYTDGVMVVGMTEIENIDNQKIKPYEGSKIKEGDRIIAINDNAITCTSDLAKMVNEAKGDAVTLKLVRENETYTSKIKPVEIAKNEYKLGLWVRDAQAGVGTISFYEPKTRKFCGIRTWNY